MILPILQIKEELLNPYHTDQQPFETKVDNLKLFYLLSGEDPYVFREGSIAQVRIVQVKENMIQVVTNGGIFGQVNFKDLFNEDNQPSETKVKDTFYIGQNYRAKILQIKTTDSFGIHLSLKNSDQQVGLDFLTKNKILDKYNLQKNLDFQIDSSKDFIQPPVEQKTQISRFQTRQLTHPFFKNLSCQKAVELLTKQQDGSFIFRPSSSGVDTLNLTWRISQNNVVHLIIKEGLKTKDESISKQLILNKVTYKSLDDIHENYIRNVNRLVQEICRHKKYLNEPIDVVVEQTIQEKQKSSQRIPYFFSFTNEQPLYLILTYIPD